MRRLLSVWVVMTLTGTGFAAACGGSGSMSSTDGGADVLDASRVDAVSRADAPGPLPPLESHPPPEIPTKKRLDATSTSVVYDALRGGVWTANGDVGTVSYVDIDSGHQHIVQEMPVGKDIRSVALSPDFEWVAAVDRDGAEVALIDPYTRRIARMIPTGTHPRAAVWDAADPRWLYVALEDDDAVGIIDRTLGTYAATVSAGRLPSGLGVSRIRRELYVSHRVDPFVSTLSIGDSKKTKAGSPAAPALALEYQIKLANQPADKDPTVPQGEPFGFEGMAWTADGNQLWLPHELLARRQPFVFNQTLFPAISVVAFTSGAGMEVLTNPNDPNGIIAGRKLLFGAIDLPDAQGNTQIVSQPCAVAMHPNGNVAYALACASEDFLVFDLTQGVAVQLLRNQPGTPFGDHPTGLGLDVKGQRAFVLSDQSHTLSTLDLGDGNLTEEVRLIAGPLPVVMKDTVDPALRAGLELFFRANSSRGSLATTGNDWMSCGGCHLDGFVSTNLRLFEMTTPPDPAKDAQIGHVGLADLFSTAPTPTSSSFNPHDILVALTEQGGLSPDRSGQSRVGAVDPSKPTAAAKTMAQEIARVVARDLPLGPTWLLSPDGPPDESYDTAWCGKCHTAEYAAWKQSAHSHSAKDEMVTFCDGVEEKGIGPQFSRLCAGCHDPVSARLGDTTLKAGRGITCLACHDTVRTIRAGGNGDLQMDVHKWTEDHKASASAGLKTLVTAEFCGGCHQQFVPGTGLLAIQTFAIWQSGPYGTAKVPDTCVDCHMVTRSGVADHTFMGGNVYLADKYGQTDLAKRETMNLGAAFSLATAKKADGSVSVTIKNVASGHDFPTGVTDIREPWVELQAVDAKGNVLAHYGGPDASGLLPPGAARLGIDIAEADGTILYEHQLSLATRIPFDVRVPPKGSVALSVSGPAKLPAGATELDAVLLYHNVRTTYYRAATGDAKGSAPAIEVARTAVH
jgi:DNA-binding beta-propeller fold protein YncE